MSLPSSLPLCLAEVTPADHPYLLYIVFGAVVVVCSAWHHVTSGILNMRRLRSDQASEGKDYVTKAELREVHGRMDTLMLEHGRAQGEVQQSLVAMSDKISDAFRTVSEQMGGIQRSLGRVEGLESVIKEHGADIDALQRSKTAR